MNTPQQAGKTGPIARHVMAAINNDVTYHPASPAGTCWSLFARRDGAHKGRGHQLSILRDRDVCRGAA